ncbi:MAG: hypothetical protein KAW88_04250 [Candidatus Cloacimonetes bacterium]|nr:hypothetical protein [Candidatus Cloacimonadota bacterium]
MVFENDSSVNDLMKKFRSAINSSVIRYSILVDSNRWYQLCSAMDCIEDTQLSIEYYKNSNLPENNGGKYLFIYGLMQALIIQQDALRNLGEVLNFEINFSKNGNYSELYKIREKRHNSIGHPTKRSKYKNKKKEWKSTHSIIRTSMIKDGFEIRSKFPNELKYDYYNLNEDIQVQNKIVKEILSDLISHIKNKERKIKMKYSSNKFINLFDNCLFNNYFAYMLEFFYGDNRQESMGKMGFKMLKEVCDKFQKKHKERYCSDEFINFDIYQLLEIFNQWLDNKIQLNRWVMYFLTKQLKIEFYKLKKTAKDIDTEFAIDK